MDRLPIKVARQVRKTFKLVFMAKYGVPSCIVSASVPTHQRSVHKILIKILASYNRVMSPKLDMCWNTQIRKKMRDPAQVPIRLVNLTGSIQWNYFGVPKLLR